MNDNEITEALGHVNTANFTRLMMFADNIDRYVDIRFKGKINPAKFIVLLWLAEAGGYLTPSEISSVLLRSNHSVTRLIDSLENEGLVVREHSKLRDRRSIIVVITQKGLSVLRQGGDYLQSADTELMNCLDDDQIELLNNYIRLMRIRLIELSKKQMNAWVYFMRGVICKRLNKKEQAIRDLKKSIALAKYRPFARIAKNELNSLI